MDNHELVILNTFTSIFEANLFKSKLESEGIECFIDDENIGSMNFLYGSAVGGVKLKVRKSDYDKARKVLKESGQTTAEVEEEKKDDNSVQKVNSGILLKVIRVLFCIAIVAAVLYMLGHRKKM